MKYSLTPSDPYRAACMLVCSYRAALPEMAPECVLQELLARGPRWFVKWWAIATPATRNGWLQDSGLASTDQF